MTGAPRDHVEAAPHQRFTAGIRGAPCLRRAAACQLDRRFGYRIARGVDDRARIGDHVRTCPQPVARDERAEHIVLARRIRILRQPNDAQSRGRDVVRFGELEMTDADAAVL
jgi:hypothetical protein